MVAVTQPDRPSGRGQKLAPSPVKAAAAALGVPVLQPERLRPFVDDVRALAPDALVVASYGKILPAALLATARLGAFNVHPSLLPLYRGATPLQSAIRDGRRETGVTIIAMDAGMDTGDILAQEATLLGAAETYGELHDRLAVDGARLLVTTLDVAARAALAPVPQAGRAPEAEVAATLTRPLQREDLAVAWDCPAKQIVDLVRSLAPAPAARAVVGGIAIKVLAAHASDAVQPAPAGTVGAVEGDALLVRAADGWVALDRVVPPNRGATSGAAFAAMRQAVRS